MEKIAVFLSACVVGAFGAGQFTVIQHPPSVIFKGNEKLDLSAVKDVLCVAAGFSQDSSYSWSGMYLMDPFSLAKSVVVLEIDGVSKLNPSKGHVFPLNTDESQSDAFETLQSRIEERNANADSKLAFVDLSSGVGGISDYPYLSGIKNVEVKKSTSYTFLKATNEEDREFLQQLELLKAIAPEVERSVQRSNFAPDVFWFKFTALHALADVYGENSTTVKEAKQLLNEAIAALSASFGKVYDDSLLFGVITNDVVHTRRTRAAAQTDGKKGEFDNLNLADNYNANYPVIFNIMLWFTVIMVFSLLAVSMAIGTMDPGHDSIIYRSTRMKKDN